MYTKQNVPKDRKMEREFQAVNKELYAPAGSAHSKWTTSLLTNTVNTHIETWNLHFFHST